MQIGILGSQTLTVKKTEIGGLVAVLCVHSQGKFLEGKANQEDRDAIGDVLHVCLHA